MGGSHRVRIAPLLVRIPRLCSPACLGAEERTERFDRDPGWDGHNHRSKAFAAREIRQDFGYSNTAHTGGKPGEIGGFITPAGEPAYYAKKLPRKTFNDKLTASGTLISKGREYHALIGFFNSDTINEWRTPNTVALRISGRGDVFYAWLEYCTQRWRAGGDDPQSFPTERDPQTGRQQFKGFAQNAVHRWTLEYDPKANNGHGAVFANDRRREGHLSRCRGAPGRWAVFNRFGIAQMSVK